MRKRSSFHFISGDRRLSKIERFSYRLSYSAERALAALKPAKTPIEIYRPTFDRASYVRSFGEAMLDASAARVLCYDFIATHGASVFAPDRAVIDLGCGRGNYAAHIRRNFGYRRYVGYDIERRPDWTDLEAEDTAFGVKELGVDPIDATGYDVAFSQSVLEHVANDAAIFHRITANPSRLLTHLHLIPAVKSYEEYRYHGYRRYAPYQIDRLTAAPGVHSVRAFALGNYVTRALQFGRKGNRSARRRKAARTAIYDPSKTMFDNLLAHRDTIDPTTAGEAEFYAVMFEQAIT